MLGVPFVIQGAVEEVPESAEENLPPEKVRAFVHGDEDARGKNIFEVSCFSQILFISWPSNFIL